MKSATKLLAEMLAIYNDPGQDIHDLHSWLHQSVDEIRDAIGRDLDDRARGEGE